MKVEHAPRSLVSASYRLSWDGRIIGQPPAPAGVVDAIFTGSEIGTCAASPSLPRVLLNPAQPVEKVLEYFRVHSRLRSAPPHGPAARGYNAGARRIAAENDESPGVIIYTTPRPGVRDECVHARKRWPLRAVLEHLRAAHGIRRVAFAGGTGLFRELVSASLLDDLQLAWSPQVRGGGSGAPITGLAGSFLPRGVEFDLVKFKRSAGECAAHYRARASSP